MEKKSKQSQKAVKSSGQKTKTLATFIQIREKWQLQTIWMDLPLQALVQ